MRFKLEEESDLDLTVREIKIKYFLRPNKITSNLGVSLIFRGKVLPNDKTLREIGFDWERDYLEDLMIKWGEILLFIIKNFLLLL